jgi:two-component system nitrogen regulation response regulator GlnG
MVDHFLAAAARELDIEPKVIQADAANLMLAYDWPGNVRQLENVCRWITVMAPGREVHVEDLPAELRSTDRAATGTDWQTVLSGWADHCLAHGESDLLSRAVPTFERILIECALKKTGGRRQDAAKLLGWGRNTLTRKIKELDMDV